MKLYKTEVCHFYTSMQKKLHVLAFIDTCWILNKINMKQCWWLMCFNIAALKKKKAPLLEHIQVWYAGFFSLLVKCIDNDGDYMKKIVFFSWKLALFNGVIILPASDVFSMEINEALLLKHLSLTHFFYLSLFGLGVLIVSIQLILFLKYYWITITTCSD